MLYSTLVSGEFQGLDRSHDYRSGEAFSSKNEDLNFSENPVINMFSESNFKDEANAQLPYGNSNYEEPEDETRKDHENEIYSSV